MKIAQPVTAAMLALAFACSAQAAEVPRKPEARADIESVTRGMAHVAGFFDVWRDEGKGRVLIGVREFEQPFLMTSSLPWALGSNDVGLDRGQSSDSRLVRFRRAGSRVLLVEDNTRFRANTASADETLSVRQAFPESVLWATDIVAERGGGVVIDAGSLLTTDLHGIAAQLERTKQGRYELDEKRSAVFPAEARSFPDNTELEAMLTFKGAG